jgi:hypothetical protein
VLVLAPPQLTRHPWLFPECCTQLYAEWLTECGSVVVAQWLAKQLSQLLPSLSPTVEASTSNTQLVPR